jgi:succinate dehydrogenase / fumarate reductase, iron-sulfur subunit
MKIILEIQRFDPAKDEGPCFRKYEVEAGPSDRLLDVLMHLKRTVEPTLGLRLSCAHGICGSDAMVIDGRERLACKTLVKDVAAGEGAVVRIEPLRTMPVQRDLMVDQGAFFAHYRKIKPYLINPEEIKEKERPQSPAERAKFDDATKCILCAACYSACPVRQGINAAFIGPAAIVQASRFLEDSRDRGLGDRLPEIDDPDGVWPCASFFECTRVCPRSIKVTYLINKTKKRINDFRKSKGEKPRGETG